MKKQLTKKARQQLEAQIETISWDILSLQSLDDLGSPEANNQADDKMRRLQQERDELEKKLAAH